MKETLRKTTFQLPRELDTFLWWIFSYIGDHGNVYVYVYVKVYNW